jgi:hypothetical protein
MFAALKSKNEPMPFATAAPLLEANGYAPIPCEFGHAMPPGPWGVYWKYYGDAGNSTVAHLGTSIALGAASGRGEDFDSSRYRTARATCCVAVKVKTTDKQIAKSADALIVERLRWRDGVSSRHAPVRCTGGKLDTLRLYALADDEQPFHITRMRPARYFLPNDKVPEGHRIEVTSLNGHVTVVGLCTDDAPYGLGTTADGPPYYWRDGLDLMRVRRDELPVIGRVEAEALGDDLEKLIESRGGQWHGWTHP